MHLFFFYFGCTFKTRNVSMGQNSTAVAKFAYSHKKAKNNIF